MSSEPTLDDLKDRAERSLKRLAGLCDADEVSAAKRLVEDLRNVREYDAMGRLCRGRQPARSEGSEEPPPLCPVPHRHRQGHGGRRPAATGGAAPAQDPSGVRRGHRLARPGPQAGFLRRRRQDLQAGARDALKQAIAAYRKPFEVSRANTWHGVNLLALLSRARRIGLRVAADLQPADVARAVIDTLESTPADRRDEWTLPTLAEASLGLGDWDAVERAVKNYAAAEDAKAFQVASTLRQFTEVWDLEHADDRGRGLVNILRARLTELPGGGVELDARDVRRLRAQPSPEAGQLEAVLGTQGPETFAWWKTGLDRAVSVAAIRQRLGGRIGSGFLVRAGDLGLDPADELVAVTNFHVVNEHGVSPGIRPEEAEVAFEASESAQTVGVDAILWSSPPDRHDASILRLRRPGRRGPADPPGQGAAHRGGRRRGSTSSAIREAANSPSRSRTTTSWIMRGRPRARRKSPTSGGFTTAPPPRAAAPAARCSTRACGR